MKFKIEIEANSQPALIRQVEIVKKRYIEGGCSLNLSNSDGSITMSADETTRKELYAAFCEAHPLVPAWTKEGRKNKKECLIEALEYLWVYGADKHPAPARAINRFRQSLGLEEIDYSSFRRNTRLVSPPDETKQTGQNGYPGSNGDGSYILVEPLRMGVPKSFPQDQLHIEKCTKFCSEVEALVEDSNKQADSIKASTGRNRPRLSYIQAVLMVAERQGMEETMAAAYLSPNIKEKIRHEAEFLNMIEKSASLPF